MAQDNSISRQNAEFNLGLVIEWIRFADNKAAFLLTVVLAVFGLSLADIPAATRVVTVCWEQSRFVVLLVVVAIHVLFYAVTVWAAIALVKAIRPRLDPESKRQSWFFFQSIGQLSAKDFNDWSDSLDEDDLLQQLRNQIYDNSVVGVQKYAAVERACAWVIWSMLLGLAAVVPALAIDAAFAG